LVLPPVFNDEDVGQSNRHKKWGEKTQPDAPYNHNILIKKNGFK